MNRLGPFELDTIVVGDCLDVMRQMPENCIDTIITDPPYGLEFMGKDWDRGVPGVRYWEAALRVAKPGAMLMAFGGTRTHHRLMCAIEDAGWQLRDVMMWVYGSGFPKSHDISKAIDKAAGEQGQYGDYKTKDHAIKRKPGNQRMHEGYQRPWRDDPAIEDRNARQYLPTTSAAKLWDGWGTALKPSWEPVIVAMKPCEGTFAENVLKWGVAGLWIDGGRIGTEDTRSVASPTALGLMDDDNWRPKPVIAGSSKGRWPANFALVHHEECVRMGTKRVRPLEGHRPNPVAVQSDGQIKFTEKAKGYQKQSYTDADGLEEVAAWDCHPDCPVRMLGEQSGESTGGSSVRHNRADPYGSSRTWSVSKTPAQDTAGFTDTGTAARFFYQAKASRRERNRGLDRTRTVKYNMPKEIGGISCQDVSMVLVQSLRKATSEATVRWCIGESGGSIMALCPVDTLSTTLTEISKITESKISRLLMQLLTSDCMVDANSVTANGGSPAMFADNSSHSQKTTGISPEKAIQLTDAVKPVISALLSKVSDEDNWSELRNTHNTVKPLGVVEYLCKLTFTPTGGVVFDPFIGSGTTAVAAKKLGRHYFGCDINPEYVEMAQGRLQNIQPYLF